MAEKMKIRILYPTAAVAAGLPADADELGVEPALAEALVAQGAAELVEPKPKPASKPRKPASS